MKSSSRNFPGLAANPSTVIVQGLVLKLRAFWAGSDLSVPNS